MATKPDYEAYAVSLGMEPRRPEPEPAAGPWRCMACGTITTDTDGTEYGCSCDDPADVCAACGRMLEDTPSGPRCPIMSLHTVEDFDKGGR